MRVVAIIQLCTFTSKYSVKVHPLILFVLILRGDNLLPERTTCFPQLGAKRPVGTRRLCIYRLFFSPADSLLWILTALKFEEHRNVFRSMYIHT
jgi:hypothetical protein